MPDRIRDLWIDLNHELYRFVLARVKNPVLAQDLVQDVFVKAQTNMHQLKRPEKLTSWVYQITRNTLIDHFRTAKNQAVDIEGLELPEKEGECFEYAQLSECIAGKIDQLKAPYQQAMVLTYLKGFSQKQLAEHFQSSYSGAKSRVQKARNILKEQVLNCPNVSADGMGKIYDFNQNA